MSDEQSFISQSRLNVIGETHHANFSISLIVFSFTYKYIIYILVNVRSSNIKPKPSQSDADWSWLDIWFQQSYIHYCALYIVLSYIPLSPYETARYG